MQMEFAVLTAKDLVTAKSGTFISKVVNSNSWQEFAERLQGII